MPDQLIPKFEQSVIENDMQRLAAEVRQAREVPERSSASDQELLKSALQSISQVTAPPPTPTVADDASSPLPGYAQGAPAASKLEIEYLLDVAFKDGVEKASEEAAKSNPFILDAFHDALVGKLYPELEKRGLLK